jgi:hypothetical protein
VFNGESNPEQLISLYPKSSGVIHVTYSPDNQVKLYECEMRDRDLYHTSVLYLFIASVA